VISEKLINQGIRVGKTGVKAGGVQRIICR